MHKENLLTLPTFISESLEWKVSSCRVTENINSFVNTKKAFKELYMFYFETFRIILNPLQSKNPS